MSPEWAQRCKGLKQYSGLVFLPRAGIAPLNRLRFCEKAILANHDPTGYLVCAENGPVLVTRTPTWTKASGGWAINDVKPTTAKTTVTKKWPT